jgi:hypothetical protein
MSHRDSTRHNGSAGSAQDLRNVFQWLLAGTDVGRLPLRADCGFTPRGLVITILLWVWSEESTLTHGFQLAREIARRVLRGGVPARMSYQAFTTLLVRWTDPLVAMLKEVFRRRLRTALASHVQIAGYCVLGVDGSRLDLPRTRANAAHFAPAAAADGGSRRYSSRRSAQSRTSRRQKGDGPQVWLTTVWQAGTGLVWDWRIGPADSSERGHLRAMLDELPAEALITADAGFVGYDTWQAILAAGHQFVIRVGGNVRLLRKLGCARESNGTVYLWPDREARRRSPPLALRLVVVHDGRQPWYLVTSVLSPRQLSDAHVAEVYRRRWGVELYFRHLKQTLGRRKLRSRTADHVRCEAHWIVVGLNALQLYALVVLERRAISPQRLSVAGALRAFRCAMRWSLSGTPPHQSLRDQVLQCVIDHYHRADKSSRAYPRKKYEPAPSPPMIQSATKTQRTLAQNTQKSRAGLTA